MVPLVVPDYFMARPQRESNSMEAIPFCDFGERQEFTGERKSAHLLTQPIS